jgi:hypothetical protein
MSTQENNHSGPEPLGMTAGHMLRRKILAGIAVLLMGAGPLSESASAHNINLAKAQEFARDYAREVREESGGKYLHYTTDCIKLFQGHNHYVRCTIEFTNDENPGNDKSAACREQIDVYLQAHNRGEVFKYYIKQYSGQCGSKRLRGAKALN